MELKNLEIIRHLVADPNLSRAAERLHFTQSALSKRVHAIESEVGCALFERRGPRGLKPLPQALELAKLADHLSTAWDLGLRRIQRVAEHPSHFVLVGPQLFLREVILPWWSRTAHRFPDLQLEVQVSSLERVSIETIQAGADAGILEHKEELADYVCKPIYTEQWGIVRNPSVHHRDLNQYAWGTYSTRNNPVDVWLVQRQKLAPPRYRCYWADLTALVLWVADTPGAASVVPWHAVAWFAKRDRVVFEPLGPDSSKRLYLAYPKKNPHAPLLKAMTELD